MLKKVFVIKEGIFDVGRGHSGGERGQRWHDDLVKKLQGLDKQFESVMGDIESYLIDANGFGHQGSTSSVNHDEADQMIEYIKDLFGRMEDRVAWTINRSQKYRPENEVDFDSLSKTRKDRLNFGTKPKAPPAADDQADPEKWSG